mgnify:FL=1
MFSPNKGSKNFISLVVLKTQNRSKGYIQEQSFLLRADDIELKRDA